MYVFFEVKKFSEFVKLCGENQEENSIQFQDVLHFDVQLFSLEVFGHEFFSCSPLPRSFSFPPTSFAPTSPPLLS